MPTHRRAQIIVHLVAILPLTWLVAAYFTGNLTVNPIQTATQRSGDTAVILLLLTLACTPLHTIFNLPVLMKLRRTLGLYTFFYAALHGLIYIAWDYTWDFRLIIDSFKGKPYLIAGLTTFLLLLPLAITSSRWWMRRLGRTWKRLHRLVYLAAIAAALHLTWAVKGDLRTLSGDIWKPLLAWFVLILLLTARIQPVVNSLQSLRHNKSLPESKIK